ncbi:MAG: hypothetical protein HSCHL_1821 [Hydrogenibacillus schlegelii]|uniref:Uncharacterized protein n=1 Tax=Hydrogenibacillus schlegelii TaxID=1484 RepID=A0A2T5GFB6_HYDSH|nr:MAG: hypothetical protein HSCHL_1821 [Hydrogenibacillus schlegelii]
MRGEPAEPAQDRGEPSREEVKPCSLLFPVLVNVRISAKKRGCLSRKQAVRARMGSSLHPIPGRLRPPMKPSMDTLSVFKAGSSIAWSKMRERRWGCRAAEKGSAPSPLAGPSAAYVHRRGQQSPGTIRRLLLCGVRFRKRSGRDDRPQGKRENSDSAGPSGRAGWPIRFMCFRMRAAGWMRPGGWKDASAIVFPPAASQKRSRPHRASGKSAGHDPPSSGTRRGFTGSTRWTASNRRSCCGIPRAFES